MVAAAAVAAAVVEAAVVVAVVVEAVAVVVEAVVAVEVVVAVVEAAPMNDQMLILMRLPGWYLQKRIHKSPVKEPAKRPKNTFSLIILSFICFY